MSERTEGERPNAFISIFDGIIKSGDLPTAENLQEIANMVDGPEKAAKALAYCVGHGLKEREFGTFDKKTTFGSELQSFEHIMGRTSTDAESFFLGKNLE